MRHASLKDAAVALRNASSEISRALVSRGVMYSATYGRLSKEANGRIYRLTTSCATLSAYESTT